MSILNRRLAIISSIFVVCFIDESMTGDISWETMIKLADGFRKACVASTGVDNDKAERARWGTLEDDEALKCYLKCIIGKLRGWKKEDYTPQDMAAYVAINSAQNITEHLVASIMKCGELQGNKGADILSCQSFYESVQCTIDDAKEYWFFP